MAAAQLFLIECLFLVLSEGQLLSTQAPITHDCYRNPVEYAVHSGDTRTISFNGSYFECFRFSITFFTQYTVDGISLQVHTWNRNATISRDRLFSYDSTTTGQNIGLMDFNDNSDQEIDFYVVFDPIYEPGSNRTLKTGRALVVVRALSPNDPVPGGCATTSNLLYDAQLSLSFSSLSTTIRFMDGDLAGRPVCDQGVKPPIKQLSYYVYVYFLPEMNYNEDVYFHAIKLMVNTSSVKSVGYKVVNLQLMPTDPKRVRFNSVTGNGVIYNVMMVGGGENVYIPTATYACDLSSDSCPHSVPVISQVTGVLIGLCGLFICLLGHRFFSVEVPIVSLWISFFVFYCILRGHTLWSELAVQLTSLGISVVPAIVVTLLWLLFGFYYPIVCVFSIFGSFLLGLIVLFTPLGTVKYLDIPYVYALVIVCLTVVLTIPFMCLELGRICCPKLFSNGVPTKITNVVTCAFLGSYGVIYCITCFLPNSLSLVWNNFLDRVTIINFDFAQYQAYPFEVKEIVLTVVWTLLVVVGISVQLLVSRKKKPFPEISLYRKIKDRRRRKRLNANQYTIQGRHSPSSVQSLPRMGIRSENSPLLSPGNTPTEYKALS